MIRNLTTKSQENKDIFRQLAHTDTVKYLNKIQKQNKTKTAKVHYKKNFYFWRYYWKARQKRKNGQRIQKKEASPSLEKIDSDVQGTFSNYLRKVCTQ